MSIIDELKEDISTLINRGFDRHELRQIVSASRFKDPLLETIDEMLSQAESTNKLHTIT